MRKGATRRGGVGVLGDLDLSVFCDPSSDTGGGGEFGEGGDDDDGEADHGL